ncbi:MAG: VOC family protein [Cyclobacteriaceae bacterium]
MLTKTNIIGLSHINVIVNDIAEATDFYSRTLGFGLAIDKEGNIMDYPHFQLETFARDAGILDGKVDVDIRFLRHPKVGIYLEIMKYNYPVGERAFTVKRTYDMGGVRHIALEVVEIEQLFEHIKRQEGANLINPSEKYGPPEMLTPVPVKFFYWIDKYGVQWEFEQGRPVGDMRGIV